MNLACWTKLVFTKPILLTRKFGIGVNCFTSQTHKSSKSQQTDANVSTVLLHKYELFYFTCRLTSATFQQMDAIIHYFRHHTPSDPHLPIRSLSQTIGSTVSFPSTCIAVALIHMQHGRNNGSAELTGNWTIHGRTIVRGHSDY